MEPDGVIESNWNEIADNFDEMNLREDLLRGIYAYGFEKPSAIQQRAIIPCIRGRFCMSSCLNLTAIHSNLDIVNSLVFYIYF